MKRYLASVLFISAITAITPSAIAEQYISVTRSDGIV